MCGGLTRLEAEFHKKGFCCMRFSPYLTICIYVHLDLRDVTITVKQTCYNYLKVVNKVVNRGKSGGGVQLDPRI